MLWIQRWGEGKSVKETKGRLHTLRIAGERERERKRKRECRDKWMVIMA